MNRLVHWHISSDNCMAEVFVNNGLWSRLVLYRCYCSCLFSFVDCFLVLSCPRDDLFVRLSVTSYFGSVVRDLSSGHDIVGVNARS